MNLLLLALALAAAPEPQRMEWTVDGVAREAVIYAPPAAAEAASSTASGSVPASTTAAPGPPLVFGFHGHGGSMQNAARTFRLHELWPEAVVVYMQGLPTPGRLTDPEGKKPGWQHAAGDQGDRDLKFFDAVLASMKEKFRIDENRVYATGHSNGGGFTYLLWGARSGLFAALAPSAAAAGFLRDAKELKPCPLLHVAGRKDPLVRFAWQELTMAAVRTLNGCEEKGKEWAERCVLYPSAKDAPVVTFIHDGDHAYPKEAPALIVRFFREQVRKP